MEADSEHLKSELVSEQPQDRVAGEPPKDTLPAGAAFPARIKPKANFEPYNANDSRNVEHVVSGPVQDRPAQLVDVRHFAINHYSQVGCPETNSKAYAFLFLKQQDSLRIVPTFERDGQIFININESLDPARAIRPAHWFNPEHSDGVMPHLAGTYLQYFGPRDSIDKAVDWVLRNKLDAEPAGPSIALGGSVMPDPKFSTESCYFRTVPIKEPSLDEKVIYADGVEQMRISKFVSLQGVVDGYFRGEFQDARMLLAAFRLARTHNIKLDIPLSLKPSKNISEAECRSPVYDRNSVKDLLYNGPTPGKHSICHIEIEEKVAPPNTALTHGVRTMQNRMQDGSLSEPYEVEYIDNGKSDSVSVAAHRTIDGKLCMLARLSTRPALKVRDLASHPIQARYQPFMVEGVSRALVKPESVAEVLEISADAVAEKIGALPDMQGATLINYDFSTNTFYPNGTYRVIAPIDHEEEAFAKPSIGESLETFYLDVEDILKLDDQGQIHDLNLILNAHILKAALEYEPEGAGPKQHDPQLRMELEALMNSDNQLTATLCSKPETAEIFERLWRFREFRKLCDYAENELGLVLHEFNEEERIFFSALIPVYAILPTVSERFLLFHLIHDLYHYPMGDIVPFHSHPDGTIYRRPNGEPAPIPFEEYKHGCLGNEVEALFASDVVIPSLFNAKEVSAIKGEQSVAEAFQLLGITDAEQAKEVLRSIVQDGVVPAEVVQHSAYDLARPAVIDRLLSLHVVFSHHIEQVYENWIRQPAVAAVAIKFSNRAVSSGTEHETGFLPNLADALDGPEGLNRLRAYIAQTINFDVRLTALRVAYFSAHMKEDANALNDQKKACLDQHLDALHDAYQRLTFLHRKVHDTEISSKNLKVFEEVRSLQEGIIHSSRQFADAVAEDSDFLNEDIIADSRGKLLPSFQMLPFDKDDLMQSEIAQLEQISIQRETKQ